MAKIDQTVLYKTQISLSEWFENAQHSQSEDLRLEDNEKRERLNIISEVTGLPFDKPYQFSAIDLVEKPQTFKDFLTQHQDELCALRLIPLDPKLPKLRMRGYTIKNSLNWFAEQKIDPSQYKADFIPHSDNQLWATTFIINSQGIFGEITKGGHYQLTQGFYDEGEPIAFTFDFKKWNFSKKDPVAQKQIKEITNKLKMTSPSTQKILTAKLTAQFSHHYLCGYFEALVTREFGIWFIDYNRMIGKMYENFSFSLSDNESGHRTIKGLISNKGKVSGKARIITPENFSDTKILEGEILICQMTTPDYLPLMQKAAAIVTDLGGVLSHAAIISRELGKPCITNTKRATQVLKTGDLIEVDADLGVINKI